MKENSRKGKPQKGGNKILIPHYLHEDWERKRYRDEVFRSLRCCSTLLGGLAQDIAPSILNGQYEPFDPPALAHINGQVVGWLIAEVQITTAHIDTVRDFLRKFDLDKSWVVNRTLVTIIAWGVSPRLAESLEFVSPDPKHGPPKIDREDFGFTFSYRGKDVRDRESRKEAMDKAYKQAQKEYLDRLDTVPREKPELTRNCRFFVEHYVNDKSEKDIEEMFGSKDEFTGNENISKDILFEEDVKQGIKDILAHLGWEDSEPEPFIKSIRYVTNVVNIDGGTLFMESFVTLP